MKLLLFEWSTYTINDVRDFFTRNHIPFKSISYQFFNNINDTFFEERFPLYLKEDSYDAVFSINYFPLVAKMCYENNIKYLAWSYDNLFSDEIEETLQLPTTYYFVFERSQVKYYKDKGFDNVYHLPLAINTHRLSSMQITTEDLKLYNHDISFVGVLYSNYIPQVLNSLDPYAKGYLTALLDSQLKLYGTYLFDELVTETLLSTINSQLRNNAFYSNTNEIEFTKKILLREMEAYVTQVERLLILNRLSNHHQTVLYSTTNSEFLPNIEYKGTAGYYKVMPKVFRCSKINLNITYKRLCSGIPLRALDILGSGGLLLTNYQEEFFDYFVNEQDIMMYESVEDSLDKATFLLNHEDIRQQIAYNGFCKANEFFSYERQFDTLFKIAGLN